MKTLAQYAKDLFGINLSSEQLVVFETYAAELADWNQRMNLTAITDPEEVQIRHFLDALSVFMALPLTGDLHLIDVGSGAGFPGLPLAIVFPNLQVTLLESTGKKVNFLDHIADTLNLTNVRTLRARAEEAGHDKLHRDQYDIVVARSVARLPALCEYLLPFVKKGGYAIAMKGSTAQTEASDSKRALQLLGGTLDRIESYQLPGLDYEHNLVIIEKTARTPKQYPRNTGIPTREPL